MKIDHLCIAAKNMKDTVIYWHKVFGYDQFTNEVINSRQKVKIVFLKKVDSLPIKLIEPLENNKSLLNIVNRGGGFHHICFSCNDVKKGAQELKEKGLRMLTEPQPGEAFNNNLLAFLFAKNNLNIELIDTEERVGII